MSSKDQHDPVVIKKYANRRLYNTGTSSYVTLEDLAQMVRRGEDFVVHDAKTGDDITHSVLTQIIFELENDKDGQKMLPVAFLRQLITFYGDQMQVVLPSFLEQSMRAFAKEQERMREQMGKHTPMGDMMDVSTSMKMFEEQTKRNLELFQDAMRMFTSSAGGVSNGGPRETESTQAESEAANQNDLEELREQVAAMQRKIDAMSKG